MKLHADKAASLSITAHGPGWIAVNGQRHSHHLVLETGKEPRPWQVLSFESLQEQHFQALLEPGGAPPQLLLLGSGASLRFVAPALLRPLIERRIGVETMDTAAACRTFNILASEGRTVLAALLVEPPAAPER